MGRKYDKLVRDDIPEIIEANNETPVTHVAEGEEYDRRLLAKLDEEVTEYKEEREPAELADVLEVVYALCEQHERSTDDIEELREQKADERGRFSEGIVLDRVDEE